MLILKSSFPLHNLLFNPSAKNLCFAFFSSSLSSLGTTSKISANPALFNCLITTYKFSETQALSISSYFPRIKSSDKPQSLFHFLRSLGFSNAHIQSAVRGAPQILFANVEKTLKPKIQFFQDLGLVDSDLVKLISKNSTLLTVSLEKKLIPCTEILKKTLLNDNNNEDLLKVLRRCNWIVSRDPESQLLSNIAFFKSCGIVGSQLAMLLRRQPRLFTFRRSLLINLLSRALDMGFSVNSGFLAQALYTVSCLSVETCERKIEIFMSFGFSRDECRKMFRKAPVLLRTSKEKLMLGINFYLNTVKFEKEVLVHSPTLMMHSIEERVIPRHRVLQTLKLKRLLKKEPSFAEAVQLREEKFLEKFIARFKDDAEELLIVYKGHLLDSSSEKDS